MSADRPRQKSKRGPHFNLYVESGPREKTTMVHVLDLLGCVANGPTTQEALDRTSREIHAYLEFLARHGEDPYPGLRPETASKAQLKKGYFGVVMAEYGLTWAVVEHVKEGSWIGQGNPDPGFKPDFERLSRKELAVHVRRLGWLGEELAGIARRLSENELSAKPAKGRPLGAILAHVINAEAEYVRVAGVTKTEEMKQITRETDARSSDPEWLADALKRMFRGAAESFAGATDEELQRETQRGQSVYTLKRGLRRALEHAWEHLREVERRMESGG